MKINNDELGKFLNSANRSTYASTSAPKVQSLRPKSQDYHFEQRDLVYHDTYFGARDFVGEEIVYKGGVPVWGMNYRGHVLNPAISTADAYKILRPALTQEYNDILPVRGPREFILENSKYTNRVEGTIEAFTGEENIFVNSELVYRLYYHGGGIE